jgi:Gpi18-like mannosyltransferase
MSKKDFGFILVSFLSWRILLFVILFFAVKFVPLQQHFLGGGMQTYLRSPWLWAWANFDGEHYLSIVKDGYHLAEQAFFPSYPLLIKLLGGGVWLGLLISNASFFLALVVLFKLLRIDYSEKVTKLAIILLLVFPTSFYFGAVYTESLFLALVVWSFYFYRKNNILLASILGMFASGTRVVGVILLPIYLLELFKDKITWEKKYLWLLLIPLGLVFYMVYLYKVYGDPLIFLHSLSSFGEQRSSTPILLPQVFYRYIFKVLPNLNYSYFAGTFTTIMEFVVGIMFLIVSVISFFKLRLSYSLFLTFGYVIPTLSGSFSSLPRYVLVLFPAFILFSVWLNKTSKIILIICYTILFVGLIISLSLFSRGFWLA